MIRFCRWTYVLADPDLAAMFETHVSVRNDITAPFGQCDRVGDQLQVFVISTTPLRNTRCRRRRIASFRFDHQ